MAIRKKNASSQGAEAKPEGWVRNQENERQQADKAAQVELKSAVTRKDLLARFSPGVVKFLQDNLGIVLKSQDSNTLYDMLQKKYTKPLPVVVTPLAYDVSSKEMVAMPKIQSIDSLAFEFPYGKVKENGRMVLRMIDPDKDHPVRVSSVACRSYLEASDAPMESVMVEKEESQSRDIRFTREQEMALEGIGISRDRLIFGNYGRIPEDVKADIADGEDFYFTGAVRTVFGKLDVAGIGRLDGNSAVFECNEWEGRDESLVIDLMEARRIGNMEIDIYDRDSMGNIRKDINGNPKLNFGAENLVKYGAAMQPMTAFVHVNRKNADTGKLEHVTERKIVQVSVLNGSLVATPMEAVMRKDNEEVVDYYKVPNVRLDKAGRVYLDGKGNKVFDFKTPADRDSYVSGIGGMVRAVPVKDYATGKTETHDLYVVPSNTKAGFGEAFLPSTTEKILADMKRHEESKKRSVRRKQNYRLGL